MGDVVIFLLIIVGLVLVLVLLNRIEKRTKLNIKKNAYTLLEAVNPTPKEIRDTIKSLRLYGGRFRKDKECVELVNRLLEKLDTVEKITD
jgi:hypothetical protein